MTKVQCETSKLFGSKSEIKSAQWEHIIKILQKFNSVPFCGMGGVTDKRCPSPCVTEGHMDTPITIDPPFCKWGYKKGLMLQL